MVDFGIGVSIAFLALNCCFNLSFWAGELKYEYTRSSRVIRECKLKCLRDMIVISLLLCYAHYH
jgi:hypothetical protein